MDKSVETTPNSSPAFTRTIPSLGGTSAIDAVAGKLTASEQHHQGEFAVSPSPLRSTRFYIEVEEDTERHCLRFSYAAESEKPVTAGTLMLHPYIAFWLLEQLVASGAEVDVEREVAE